MTSKVVRTLLMGLFAVAAVPLVLGTLLGRFVFAPLVRGALFVAWQLAFGRRGVRGLAVYSDSPRWKTHFEGEVLSPLGARVRVVNTTDRPDWRGSRGIARRVHRAWGGGRAHTPIVIWFPAGFGRVEVIRFYEAYGRAAQRSDGSQWLEDAVRRTQALARAPC